MGFLVGFLGFWTFVGWKVCCEAGDVYKRCLLIDRSVFDTQ